MDEDAAPVVKRIFQGVIEGKSRKKRRHEMTEEQRAALRERDKVRYARKVAAKKAAEEAQRAAILKGTAYEIRPQEAGAAHAAI